MSRKCASLVLILLLAAPAAANAQVYRCEQNGTVAFSDRPCNAGARSTSKAYEASGPAGSVDFKVTVNHYAVRGDDYPSLLRSLRINGPNGFHGLARWNINYDYTIAPRHKACEIATVRVRVTGDILMPRWVDAASAPLDLQRRWTDYYAALQRHEDGHVQHGRELALLVKQRLMGLGAVPCDRLPALAQSEYDRLYANLITRDKEYDARTRHGATQGALLPDVTGAYR